MAGKILVFGGDKDFNTMRYLKRALQRGVQAVPLLYGSSGNPSFNYDINNNVLKIDGQEIDISGLFVRYNVFEFLDSNNPNDRVKANNRHLAIQGWMQSNPGIKVMNRAFYMGSRTNKIRSLSFAKKHGLAVPETHVTDDLAFVQDLLKEKAYIYKEIDGGKHTEELDLEALKEQKPRANYPIFIQEKLVKPELRVFRVGQETFFFKIISDNIDFRQDKNVKMEFIDVDQELAKKVISLTDELKLDFSALDFKSHEKTGEYMFLEANSQPMFTAFDELCDYKLVDAMIDFIS